jgi:fused signal recognition particle receptor
MKLKNLFKSSLKEKLNGILSTKMSKEDMLEEVEELLVLSDISMEVVDVILQNIRKSSKSSFGKDEFFLLLKDEIKGVLGSPGKRAEALSASSILPVGHLKMQDRADDDGKKIIMLVGINGSGKTTSAAKLSYYYKNRNKKVLMSAADTFRAAGSSQLSMWGERLDIPVIGAERGADPGSVVYNSLSSFTNKDYDVLVIDTAGRVQTKDNLMKELEKLTKIVKKFIPSGPTDTLLVVDATQGQNTLDQAKRFREFSGISGMVLSKIDGSAKGGTVLNIVHQMGIPVKFVGTGEKEGDLTPFSLEEFVDSLISD